MLFVFLYLYVHFKEIRIPVLWYIPWTRHSGIWPLHKKCRFTKLINKSVLKVVYLKLEEEDKIEFVIGKHFSCIVVYYTFFIYYLAWVFSRNVSDFYLSGSFAVHHG